MSKIKAELIEYMGDDLRVVNSARVSFDKESEWNVGKDGLGEVIHCLDSKDEKLIHYLAKHSHWTPFSHCMITLRETVPIFVARERFRHTVGFTYNEVSRRYVDSPPEFYSPEIWRRRAEDKKQGSSDERIDLVEWAPVDWEKDRGNYWGSDKEGNKWVMGPENPEIVIASPAKELVEYCNRVALMSYSALLEAGAAPELARMVLPQSMMTSYYVTGSLAAFARAYKLRSQPDAQYEIQLLAEQWNEIIEPLFPISWEALTAYGD